MDLRSTESSVSNNKVPPEGVQVKIPLKRNKIHSIVACLGSMVGGIMIYRRYPWGSL
jgi:hypothetical protein